MDGFSLLEEGSVGIPIEEQPNAPPPAPGSHPPPPPPVDPTAWLRKRVCSSEAVLLGHPNGERVLLNRDETFLFTDYVIAVEKWIRPARRLESILESITLSAIGGEVELPGRTLRAIAVPRLMPRHPYILFMRRLEGTNGFAYQSAPRPVNLHSFTVSPEESSKGPIV